MTALIAGCGDLGTEIGLRLAATGRVVHGLRRNPEKLPDAITGHGVDLSREVPTIGRGTEIVVMATSADTRSEQGYRRAYLEALRNLLDAVADRPPRRMLLVSSTGVYGSPEGWVDEETPARPETPTARVLLEAEELLRRRMPGAVSLRLAGLYGPGRGRLIEQVRTGDVATRGADRYTNRIHRDDAAAAAVHLVTRHEQPHPVYVGVDDEPSPRSAVLAYLAGELGLPPPTPLPGSAVPTGKRCRNERLRSTGFRFRHPTYREGYRAVLAGEGTRHP